MTLPGKSTTIVVEPLREPAEMEPRREAPPPRAPALPPERPAPEPAAPAGR
ncbi:MAG TPA: hypothetical protein VF529_11625 [Solirubrobacteraceae bacterium]|jgi:hypothetical protein